MEGSGTAEFGHPRVEREMAFKFRELIGDDLAA
jgi:hypothetical protein